MVQRWAIHLTGLVTLCCCCIAFASGASPLRPFQADYEVLRNGSPLGRAKLALRDVDGSWEFTSHTKGTTGMAGMLGLDVEETSLFRWHDGLPVGLQYSYAQHAAIKSRRRSTDFDWQAGEARSQDGKRDWVAMLDRDAMDRSLVTLALMARLSAGSTDLNFAVVDKDHVAEQRYVQAARESLPLPAGTIDAIRIERRRDDGDRRTTTSWFAPQRGWLPVQIEQVEKNGETITMRLIGSR